tara:strand:+ start:1423 stop:1566 length:144 start_codon:yes stop_codon:yes gene_type:complete
LLVVVAEDVMLQAVVAVVDIAHLLVAKVQVVVVRQNQLLMQLSKLIQ